MDYFLESEPIKVEWINDSSCNVTFPTEEAAQAAIFSKSTEIEGNEHALDWRKGLDLEKEGKTFNFMIRPATSEDKKQETTKGAFSKYYKFSRQQNRKNKDHVSVQSFNLILSSFTKFWFQFSRKVFLTPLERYQKRN